MRVQLLIHERDRKRGLINPGGLIGADAEGRPNWKIENAGCRSDKKDLRIGGQLCGGRAADDKRIHRQGRGTATNPWQAIAVRSHGNLHLLTRCAKSCKSCRHCRGADEYDPARLRPGACWRNHNGARCGRWQHRTEIQILIGDEGEGADDRGVRRASKGRGGCTSSADHQC
jgi:hypothetical protein